MKDLRARMSVEHEKDISRLLGATRSPGSGNQWHTKADGRLSRFKHRFAWVFDCKATRAASITITLEQLDKLDDEAAGERPIMPIRFYEADNLTVYRDKILVDLNDFLELTEVAGACTCDHPSEYQEDS